MRIHLCRDISLCAHIFAWLIGAKDLFWRAATRRYDIPRACWHNHPPFPFPTSLATSRSRCTASRHTRKRRANRCRRRAGRSRRSRSIYSRATTKSIRQSPVEHGDVNQEANGMAPPPEILPQNRRLGVRDLLNPEQVCSNLFYF